MIVQPLETSERTNDTTADQIGLLSSSSSILANNPRLSTQYSSDRVIVKLNNHYNQNSSGGSNASGATSTTTTTKTKYHRNEFKNIFSLLSNKPKISSRMNQYRFDSANGTAENNPAELSETTTAAILTVTPNSGQRTSFTMAPSSKMNNNNNKAAMTRMASTTATATAKINNDGQYSPPTTPNVMPIGRSVSCDFTAAIAAAVSVDDRNKNSSSYHSKNSTSSSTTTTPQEYSIPVIDYTNDDYVITRL